MSVDVSTRTVSPEEPTSPKSLARSLRVCSPPRWGLLQPTPSLIFPIGAVEGGVSAGAVVAAEGLPGMAVAAAGAGDGRLLANVLRRLGVGVVCRRRCRHHGECGRGDPKRDLFRVHTISGSYAYRKAQQRQSFWRPRSSGEGALQGRDVEFFHSQH